MQQFIMLVGVAASGKSTLAQKFIAEHDNYVWISSDLIRKELWGDENDQRSPQIVFNEMYERTVEALRDGMSVIYDATNVTASYRIDTLENLKVDVGEEIAYDCVVIVRPLEILFEMDKKRSRQVGKSVIRKQYNKMTIPTLDEGWDNVCILYKKGTTDENMEVALL